jgi:hypothetical protein
MSASPDRLDALIAAPETHSLLFENDDVRVIASLNSRPPMASRLAQQRCSVAVGRQGRTRRPFRGSCSAADLEVDLRPGYAVSSRSE